MILIQSNTCLYVCCAIAENSKQFKRNFIEANICYKCWEQIILDNSEYDCSFACFSEASRSREVKKLIPCKLVKVSMKHPSSLSHATFPTLFNQHRTKLFVRDTNRRTDLHHHIARETVRHRYIHTQMTQPRKLQTDWRHRERVDNATVTLLFVKLIQEEVWDFTP